MMYKNLLSGRLTWNTLAFRGRLMSLLAPASGMSTLWPRQEVCKHWPQRPDLACLPLNLDGFSRPSSIRTPGSPLGLFSPRSEEHTSELQSRGHLVCRLLLEKKNNIVF